MNQSKNISYLDAMKKFPKNKGGNQDHQEFQYCNEGIPVNPKVFPPLNSR